MSAPFYLLVVMYAIVKLILHATVLFIESFSPNMTIPLVTLNPAVLDCYDVCLSDLQQRHSELLQLTAGYTHQRSVQTCEAKI
jgi:hypothetical protein